MYLDCKFSASVQNCACWSICQECIGVDEYVSACVNCATCSSLRSLLFITRLIFVMYCLRVNETSPIQIPIYILKSLANRLPCKKSEYRLENREFCFKMPCWFYIDFRNLVSWVTIGRTWSNVQCTVMYHSYHSAGSLVFGIEWCEYALLKSAVT